MQETEKRDKERQTGTETETERQIEGRQATPRLHQLYSIEVAAVLKYVVN